MRHPLISRRTLAPRSWSGGPARTTGTAPALWAGPRPPRGASPRPPTRRTPACPHASPLPLRPVWTSPGTARAPVRECETIFLWRTWRARKHQRGIDHRGHRAGARAESGGTMPTAATTEGHRCGFVEAAVMDSSPTSSSWACESGSASDDAPCVYVSSLSPGRRRRRRLLLWNERSGGVESGGRKMLRCPRPWNNSSRRETEFN